MHEDQIKLIKREFKSRFSLSFRNKDLLLKALKHRSYLIVSKEDKIHSNERLEFLGDSILNFILTEYLYENYPQKTEGQLSKMKSILVSKKVLAATARKMELGQFILLNHGEEKTGGRNRASVLADTVEAIIGAIYLDRGLAHAKAFIYDFLIVDITKFMNNDDMRNYKSELLELIQANSDKMPIYTIVQESGPEHNKMFYIEVHYEDRKIGNGQGLSKKAAEQDAAKSAVNFLENNAEILKYD